MLDRYWRGEATRISPEAPVPVVKMGFEENRPGGAANVAYNLAVLGVDVNLKGLIGNDEAGEALSAELTRRGVKADLIALDTHPTIKTLEAYSVSPES